MELRNLILEKRWVCHRHKHLLFELKHLEFDRDRNKIDHPDHVQEIEFPEDGSFAETMMEGSKDCSDSVAASVYNALIRAKASLSDADEIQKGLDRMSKRPGALGLAPDWFVLDEKKVGKDGKPVSVLFDPDQKAKAVVDGLQKLRGLKGI
jgi:hypothetical protein